MTMSTYLVDIRIKGSIISPFPMPNTNTIPLNHTVSIATSINDSAPVHSSAMSGSVPPITSMIYAPRTSFASSGVTSSVHTYANTPSNAPPWRLQHVSNHSLKRALNTLSTCPQHALKCTPSTPSNAL